jgi:hypothetical protein
MEFPMEEQWYDLAPPIALGAAGSLGPRVATRVLGGRGLGEVLGDEDLRDELDDHPDVLWSVARDASIRAALAVSRAGAAG